ncbi:lipopolysaccharide assembly protein LapB [Amycolatopsis sp. ATCC 39116]|uniref:tetratricopeptide repeat protein n=1 Tax=Amycolatopsis sp. (strain ATCC 39116 / 75iv2) TaxID=385957 RepID=UPI0002625645|nr:ATP-binding protein [Amycolatopsis sp. ATCC 39116]
MSFAPVDRMRQRIERAREESDAAYFFELLYFGEMVIKILVVEILAGIQEDREGHRYALERRLLTADSIGSWAEVLDDILTGPVSQQLVPEARNSQSSIAAAKSPIEETWQRQAVLLLQKACAKIDAGREDLSRQKVSLRQWVRNFVWLRNRTRGHGATKPLTFSAASADLNESVNLVVDNLPAFSRSWAYLHRSLSGKYRVSSFGGSRDPFVYLTRENDHSFPDGCYVFLGEPRRVPLLFSDAELNDFFLPNGNFNKGSFESLSYISDEIQTREGSTWLLPADARPTSETAAAPGLDVIGNVFTNMPPRRPGYVSRGRLQDDLKKILLDARHPIVTLQGRGGVGKTSLALEVLHQLADDQEFFAIVWFSARDIDLLPEGPRVVRADVLSVDDVARDFSALMHREPLSPREATRYLTDCLSGESKDGPFLFVFDNFETVRDPLELYISIDNCIRLPNKVLITTRTRDFKADYPIEVRGMTPGEFARLVHDTAIQLGIAHLVDDRYRDMLYEESDGHPYVAKVLLGEVAREQRLVTPKRAIATKEAMLDALFDRSYEALSPAAKRVFLTLSSWRSSVPKIGLEAVLLRPANERLDFDSAVLELQQMSLVEMIEGASRDDVFLTVPLAAAVFGRKKLVTSPLKIAIDVDLALLRGFGVTTTAEASRGVAPRIDGIARVTAVRAEQGLDVSQELGVIRYMATAYPQAWLVLAELQHNQLNNTADAIESLKKYLEGREGDVLAWKRLIQLYRNVGDPIAELTARLQLVELGQVDFKELSSTANRFNKLLASGEIVLDGDEKRLTVRKLRRLLEENADQANANDLSRLAWLCLHDRDSASARRWANEGLQLDPENQHCLSLKRRLDHESRSTSNGSVTTGPAH